MESNLLILPNLEIELGSVHWYSQARREQLKNGILFQS